MSLKSQALLGVTRAKASYPEAKAVIGFDSSVSAEKTLNECIAACGFGVA